MEKVNIFEKTMEVFEALENNEYEECFVAFVDILGFSNLLKNTKKLSDLAPLFSLLQLIQDNAKRKNKIVLTRFSDSFFVIAPKDAFGELLDFLSCFSMNLLTNSWQQIDKVTVEQMECRLLRGGVCYGKVFSLKSYLQKKQLEVQELDDLIVGPAVPKAYELESQSAVFPRIVIDENTVKKAITSGEWDKMTKKSILKKDTDGIVYLDIIEFIRENRKKYEFPEGKRDEVIAWARQQVVTYEKKECEKICEKYKWLVKYLESKTLSVNK